MAVGNGHGGGVFAAARELGMAPEAILDFSASINPLGMPDEVRAAALAAVDACTHYPEIGAESLVAALAQFHGLGPEHLLAGNGSTPLFYLLARVLRPRRALLVEPAFSEYRRSLVQAGTAIDVFPLAPQDGFALKPEQLLAQLRPDTDLVLLANPGNPSGVAVPPAVLLELAARLRGRALLAVDEAFVDFAPRLSILADVARLDDLCVFRSLTKFYAIPGLRAGYLAAAPQLTARLVAAAEPWALATPALAAARACLAAEGYRQRTLAMIPELRDNLASALRGFGWTVFPSQANYLLAQLPATGPDAVSLAAELRQQGILLRSCEDFPTLDRSFLRLAVRGAGENARLLAAVQTALQRNRRDERG